MSALLGPFMPNTSRELRAQLGLDKVSYGYIPDTIMTFLPAGHKIRKPSPLFTKIEDQQIESLRKKYAGKQDSPSREIKPANLVQAGRSVAELEAQIAKQVRHFIINKLIYFTDNS